MPATSRETSVVVTPSDARGRFVAAILGAAAVSLIWVIWSLATSPSPEQAQARRAAPLLPAPSAAVQRQELRDVTWYSCAPDADMVSVGAPRVPAGQRSVVTSVVDAGTKVRTGTRLGSVAGVQLTAVASRAVFYRDLYAGDTGPDVRGFTTALARVGIIDRPEAVLNASTIAVWQTRTRSPAAPGRVPFESLVAVPPGSEVSAVLVAVGDVVRQGAPLLEVGASSRGLLCEVPDPSGDITPASVMLEGDGQPVKVASLVVRPRTRQTAGAVVVMPAEPASGAVRLGVESASSEGEVLTVPLSAVRTSTSGELVVIVVDDGDREEVPVTLGVSAQGWVEVAGSELVEGASVELFDQASDASGAPTSAP